MAANDCSLFPPPCSLELDEAAQRRVVLSIAAGAGLASFAMNFWWPFLPLYMLQIGATSDANALFWLAIATTGQGVARLVSGPAWGVLSDRYGRKLMLVRALYAATATTFIAAGATEPWHIAVAMACQGLFSGFIPAAVALTSVSVPEARLHRSLGSVTGAQYLGTTLGPAVGGLLAVSLGYRGAIVAGAMLPALAATWIIFAVPRDRTGVRAAAARAGASARTGWRRILGTFPAQFYLAVFLFGALFTLSTLVRLATPIAIENMAGDSDARAAVGVMFTLAGAGSVVGIFVVARGLHGHWSLRDSLIALCLVAVAAHLWLAGAGGLVTYAAAFVIISIVGGAMIPATNTLIASTVDSSRRGTAFGIASSAQAIAFMLGPTGAALFAAVSIPLGFAITAAAFAGLAVLLFLGMRREDPQAVPG